MVIYIFQKDFNCGRNVEISIFYIKISTNVYTTHQPIVLTSQLMFQSTVKDGHLVTETHLEVLIQWVDYWTENFPQLEMTESFRQKYFISQR